MERKLTTKEIRKQFRKDTGMDATIKTMTEGKYMSGLPKKKMVEQFHPAYTVWLEQFLIDAST